MMGIKRLYVEKKSGCNVEAKSLLADIKENLGITELEDVKIYNRYDVEGISDSDFETAKTTIFSEPPVDNVFETLEVGENEKMFAVEFLPGQYDQRADTIVIAAPYWDLAFPAVLKAYLENICVCGVTFKYSEEGIPVGLCKAKKLYYITTSVGYIGQYNMGYDYIKALCKLYFGITDTECISAEGLDIFGNDTEKILAEKIRSL